MRKPTVILDLDGVIHSYASGWQGADTIPDPPVEGIAEAIANMRKYCRIVVSSRCYQPGGAVRREKPSQAKRSDIMKFIVAADIFDHFPTACFGVVIAKGFPQGGQPAVADKLAASLAAAGGNFPDGVKSHPAIAVWRDAFAKLGLNPNKFASSVEALHTRAVKTGHIPSINNIVDLGNAVSLKYILPIGAHDLGRITGDIHLRLSRAGDIFTPFGSLESEDVPPGEIVYADGAEVRTRRWVWRQGEKAKIGDDSRDIFYPIDGFADRNKDAILAAREELAAAAAALGCRTEVFFIDSKNPVAEWAD